VSLVALVFVSAGPGWAAADEAESNSTVLPPNTDSSWWLQVENQIQASEYEITWQDQTVLPGLDGVWHSPNRSHNLRTYFTDDGVRVVERTESTPSWELGLSLIGYGRREIVFPVGKATLSPHENRIDYDREEIVEWYVNEPRGLEQGFTLIGPPEQLVPWGDGGPIAVGGRGREAGSQAEEESEPAFLVLALGGSVSPVMSADGQAIDFAAPGGARVLRYAHLKVTDARGRELSAWMEGFAEAGVRGIRIVFIDDGATYPVTVDPLMTSPAWIVECDQDSANFGYGVSTAGDVNGDGYADVIVGAPLYDNGETNEGRAYVYHGSAAGLSPVPDWVTDGGMANARLGWSGSVSTAGDVNGDGYADVIVGALYYTNGESNEGRAWVHLGSATGLSATAAWSAEGDQINASFGRSVSAAGDVNGDGYADVVVGAFAYDNGQNDEGRAYVYHGSPAGLSTTANWIAESDHGTAHFGIWVSTAGDVDGDGYADVIVGASGYDNPESGEGRAYLYNGSAAGLSDTPDWITESNQVGASFGNSVSTAGDVNADGYADVIVGADGYNGGHNGEGKAYVYLGSSAGLNWTPDWVVEGNQTNAVLGGSVSTAGDVNGDGYADVIVGASQYDNGEAAEGRVFIYLGSAGGLTGSAAWSADGGQVGAIFGIEVSTAGDVNGDGYADVIVGARGHDNGQLNEGRASVYHGGAVGPSATPGWTADGNQNDAQLGSSVSTAGDVNGDGYTDLIVGAPHYDNGEADEGWALVYHGSATGPSTTADWSAESNQANAFFGNSVSTAGDVNGDGYDDVIVGARIYSNGEAYEGRAFVYHGSAVGLGAMPDWTAESDQIQANFGSSVSTAGDVNGDGYADAFVGANLYDDGEENEGRAYVYHGSAAGLSTMAGWTAEGDQLSASFGSSVSTAGDVNGDGYADVLIGANSYSNGEVSEGRAYLYYGSAAGLSTTADWITEGNQDGADFGRSVSTAGDINGDGYADVIVSASYYSNVETQEGKAFVYHGSSAGLSTIPGWTAEGNQEHAYFGWSVSSAGDVNGDGYADVVIGARRYDNVEVWEGRAYVYHGSAAGLSPTADWTAESNQDYAHFGESVSTAGDVNGDGCADVIVGAYLFDNGGADDGQALVYYGNHGPGLALQPQQRRADNLAPIASGGRSRESGSFRLAALGRTPSGHGQVRLEWEIKPLGRLFDGTGTGQSPWLDSSPAGVAFNELITGLEPGPYHWRLRLLYDPATSPLQGFSRWFTQSGKSWQERDLTISPYLGGHVWEDRNGDGIMQPAEPRLSGVLVHLLDEAQRALQTTFTRGDGGYRLDVGSGGMRKVRFQAPVGWAFTFPDQGVDDLLDSDADTVTGETALLAPPFDSLDEERWSAGLWQVGFCTPPDETVYIYNVTLTTDGNAYPVLHFQDPNQLGAVTGYNVYRSPDAGLPHDQWPLMADNVIDMDESEPNKQWVDTSGDVSPSGVWYFQVAPYNQECPEQTAVGPW
jgi:hypothetical protein